MSRLTKIIHRSYGFHLALVGGESFVLALDCAYFNVRRVNTNKVFDCYKFVDFQISWLSLQVVETGETVETIYCYRAVKGTADENVRIGHIEGETRYSFYLVFILVDKSFRLSEFPYR